jgi:hypothetical protein
MTPLQIEIALYYFSRADDYRDGDFRAPAVREEIDWFVAKGLLEAAPEHDAYSRKYVATEGLRLYVETLCAIPLPVQQWIIPDRSAA